MYVVGGVHKGPGEQHPRNQDLWELLWDTLAEREGGLDVAKVKSHPTANQAKGFPTLHLLANQAADQEAAKGAVLAGLPTSMSWSRLIFMHGWSKVGWSALLCIF